jgi:hypothetical protein
MQLTALAAATGVCTGAALADSRALYELWPKNLGASVAVMHGLIPKMAMHLLPRATLPIIG